MAIPQIGVPVCHTFPKYEGDSDSLRAAFGGCSLDTRCGSYATPVCALVRNDREFVGGGVLDAPAAKAAMPSPLGKVAARRADGRGTSPAPFGGTLPKGEGLAGASILGIATGTACPRNDREFGVRND